MTTAPVPTVSVIIPAYRAAGTIRRAVGSLLAQTVPPSEIVIVDDGSPEDLAPMLAGYDDRVRLLRKANGGAASARNSFAAIPGRSGTRKMVTFASDVSCVTPEMIGASIPRSSSVTHVPVLS